MYASLPRPSARVTRRHAVTLAAGAAVLSACRPAQAPGGQAEAPKAPAKPVTLSYHTFWPQYRLDIMQTAMPAFKERRPHVTVELVNVPDYRAKLATNLAAGTAADCNICDVFQQPFYVDGGHVLDLTDRLKRDGIDIQKESWLMGYEILCGRTYHMPWVLSPHCIYYNKTMLKKVGAKDPWDDLRGQWTWEDFRQICKQVSALTSSDGRYRVYGIRIGLTSLEYQLGGFIYTNGGRNYALNPLRYTLDDPKLIETVEWFFRLLQEEGVILPPNLTGQYNQASPGGDAFYGQLVAFFEDSTGRLTLTRDTVKDNFEWDVVRVPKPNPGAEQVTQFAADANFVYAKGPALDEAYEFLKFLSGYAGREMQDTLSREKLLLPSNKAAARSPEGFLKPPPNHVRAFIEGRAIGHMIHGRANDGNTIIAQELTKALQGEKTPRQALLDAQQQCQQILTPAKCQQADTFNYSFSN